MWKTDSDRSESKQGEDTGKWKLENSLYQYKQSSQGNEDGKHLAWVAKTSKDLSNIKGDLKNFIWYLTESHWKYVNIDLNYLEEVKELKFRSL